MAMLMNCATARGELITCIEATPKLGNAAASLSEPKSDAPVQSLPNKALGCEVALGHSNEESGHDAGTAQMKVPAPPSSLKLLLSALLSVSAWQVTKSAKYMHCAVPDWYHSGGPVQVGHVTPFDLVFNSPALVPLDSFVVTSESLVTSQVDDSPIFAGRDCTACATTRGPHPSNSARLSSLNFNLVN
ncbi:MAG: hypothetical protein IPK83_03425 [Planctomycetes bacterium]|nr:hypothetical protein [Planctomycetota bacterium]